MKLFYLFISLVLLCSCSNSEPWIGEWKPSTGKDDGIIEFLSNGAVVYNQQSDEGSILIYGYWKKDSDEKREVSFKFDASTTAVKLHKDNPLLEAVLYMAANELASEKITFQFSEDYKMASAVGGEMGDYVKISSGSGKFDNVKPPVEENNEKTDAGEDTSLTTIEDRAVADLYRCYYSEKMLSENGEYGTYSNEMKKSFSSKGINSSIKDPFSKSFQALVDQAGETSNKYNDLIIDYDLLWGGQDIPGNFNIEITGVEAKDDDHVLIKSKVTNYNDTKSWEFLMVRENDTFKIDDIIDGGSTRKFLSDEIKRVEQYYKSSTQDFETYKGKVGENEIEMKLRIEFEGVDEPAVTRCLGVSGSYRYTKAGNTLNLSGYVEMWPGMDEETSMYDYPIYILTEINPAGKESGEWVLYSNHGDLFGELKTHGKVLKVKLKKVS